MKSSYLLNVRPLVSSKEKGSSSDKDNDKGENLSGALRRRPTDLPPHPSHFGFSRDRC